MIYCPLLCQNLPCKDKVVMLPLLNTKTPCNRRTTTLFSLPLPNQLCVGRLSQLRVFHPFDMKSQFLIKRERLLCNCNCNCAWSSPKHVLASFCTVRSISLEVAAEGCQSDARLFRCVVLKLCCLFLC